MELCLLHCAKVIIAILALIRSTKGLLMFPKVDVNDACMRAICNVDSGCMPEGCSFDELGRAGCGFLRLNIYQYKQCFMPGKERDDTVEEAWMRCTESFDCSESCVQRLVNRFKLKCYGKSDCEMTSRIKAGGASGCRHGETLPYWNKVQEKCENNCETYRKTF